MLNYARMLFLTRINCRSLRANSILSCTEDRYGGVMVTLVSLSMPLEDFCSRLESMPAACVHTYLTPAQSHLHIGKQWGKGLYGLICLATKAASCQLLYKYEVNIITLFWIHRSERVLFSSCWKNQQWSGSCQATIAKQNCFTSFCNK